jgi:Zn-dependent protease
MRATIRLGKIAGIPIGVNWSLLVFGVILTSLLAGSQLPAYLPNAHGSYWAAAIIAAVLFFASILAHELAHSLVALHFGQRVEEITLWLLGGVSRLGSESPSPRAEFLVAIAGPATSAFLAVAFFALGQLLRTGGGDSLLSVVLIWLGLVNGILAVFNLLPGSPLDGGRVVSAVLWKMHGDRRRAQIGAARAGRVVGALLIGLGVLDLFVGVGVGTLWTALVGWFILEASKAEEDMARASRAFDGRHARDLMTPAPPEVPDWITAENLRTSMAPPPPHQRAIVLRSYDGSVRSTVAVDAVRVAPNDVRLRDIAVVAVTASPDAEMLDVLRDAPPIAAIVVMDGNQVVGIIGRDELRAAETRGEPAPAGGFFSRTN